MAKQPNINFWLLRTLQKVKALKADPSQEQSKNFLVLKSFNNYAIQSLLAIFGGWLLATIVSFEGPGRHSQSKRDPYAPWLLEGYDTYVNLLIVVAIILCQFVYIALRVRFNKSLLFKIGVGFWALVASAALSVWLVNDYYSKLPNLQKYNLYLSSPKDFALVWIALGTLVLLGYEMNRVNTRTQDYELELESAKEKISLLVDSGDRLDVAREVEFTFTFSKRSRVDAATRQLKNRAYKVTTEEMSTFKTKLIATKGLNLKEIFEEISPMMDIALENKGYYLSFTTDSPNTGK